MSGLGGIIRPARRPAGWRPPGPAPAPASERESLGPRAGEDLCHLSGEWRILQRLGGHRWSLDDLVTGWVAADVARVRPPARIADLGCGIGAVLLLSAWCHPQAHVVGVEAQEISVDLARRSIRWNGAADRCEVRLGDLRDAWVFPEGAAFDLVTGTPPYLALGTGRESRRVQWGPCHFEHRGGVEEYCAAAARLLAPGGIFVGCAAAGQLARVERGAAAAGLVSRRRLDVVPRAGKAPLFSVHVLARGEVGEGGCVDRPLVVRDSAGQWTPAFVAVRTAMGLPVAANAPAGSC